MLGLAKKENQIMQALIVSEYKYMVVGYFRGQIKVWKISNSKKLIHQFDEHTKQIDSLYAHSDKRMFWYSDIMRT